MLPESCVTAVGGERRTLTILLVLSFICPLAAMGIYLLSMRPAVVDGDGIINLSDFQDIVPMSRNCKRYAPALGACLGVFCR